MISGETWGSRDDELFKLTAAGVPEPDALLRDRETQRGGAYDHVDGSAPQNSLWDRETDRAHYRSGYERVENSDGSTTIVEADGQSWAEVTVDGRVYEGPNDPIGYYVE